MALHRRQFGRLTVFSWNDVGSNRLIDGPVAATIGVFDGLHKGHQALFQEILATDAQSLVVTFTSNPKKLVQTQFLGDLQTFEEKLELWEAIGVQNILAIDFSPEFSKMSGREFFDSLKTSFTFSKLVLGWNFSFGKDSATTAAEIGWMAEPTTELKILPAIFEGSHLVSSSAIRTALLSGDVALARTLLGRNYALSVPSQIRWESGWYRVKNADFSTLVPAPGVYPCRLDGEWVELCIKEDITSWESPSGRVFKKIIFL